MFESDVNLFSNIVMLVAFLHMHIYDFIRVFLRFSSYKCLLQVIPSFLSLCDVFLILSVNNFANRSVFDKMWFGYGHHLFLYTNGSIFSFEYWNWSFIEVSLVLKLFKKRISSSSDFVHTKKYNRCHEDEACFFVLY